MVLTNSIESFRAMVKRAFVGTFHQINPKYLHRHIGEFAGWYNVRLPDTIDQMELVASNMEGKRLTYRMLIASDGLPSGARASQ